MATPTGIEPVISSVTGKHVNRYTTGPLYFFIRIRTSAYYTISAILLPTGFLT